MPQLNADQFKALTDVLGMEAALQVVQDGTAREKALQAANVAFKSETPPIPDNGKAISLEIETEPEAPEAEMESGESEAYTIKALCEKMDAMTGAITKMMEMMANKAVATPAPEPVTPPVLTNERKTAIIQDMLTNTQKAVGDRDSVFDITQLVFGGSQ